MRTQSKAAHPRVPKQVSEMFADTFGNGRARAASTSGHVRCSALTSLLHEPLETICEVPGSARVRSTT